MRRTVALLAASLWPALAMAGSAPATNAFSVATWNVFHDNTNLVAMVETIRRMDADLICLQETTPNTERVIRAGLGRSFGHMLFSSGGWYADGFGILSKSPFTRTNYLSARHGTFGAWIVETRVGDRTVQVVNLHLSPPNTRRLDSVWGALQMFGEADALHVREIERIWSNLVPDKPVLLLGDFNDFATSGAIRLLSDRGLTDSFASMNASPETQGTWARVIGGRELRFRIDFVLHSRELQTVASRILDPAGSDHRPVVSRLIWRPDR